jgi:hypothetical protein
LWHHGVSTWFAAAAAAAAAAAMQVAQALLTTALQPPMENLTGRRLTHMLMAAKELGAAPVGDEMQRVEAFTGSDPEW